MRLDSCNDRGCRDCTRKCESCKLLLCAIHEDCPECGNLDLIQYSDALGETAHARPNNADG